MACDDGPIGLVDSEDGVRAEVTSSGIVVENQKSEPIWAVAYGEETLVLANPAPQTADDPGQRIGEGDRFTFAFDEAGPVRSRDAYYRVSWITIKGDDRRIGPRGTLELER